MSGLFSSAFAATQQAAASERTAQNRATTRYRMATAPDGMQMVPRLEKTPPPQPRSGWGCYRMARVFLSSPGRNQYTSARFFGPPRPAAKARRSFPQNGRPVHLVLRKHPRFLPGGSHPLAPCRQFHDRGHIGPGDRADSDGVGVEPRDDRRVHGVGGAEGPEQKCAARTIAAAAIAPDRLDAPYIGLRLRREFTRPNRPAHVHGKKPPQGSKAG